MRPRDSRTLFTIAFTTKNAKIRRNRFASLGDRDDMVNMQSNFIGHIFTA